MEQFSHDLTLALEETSRYGDRIGRWGMRRRTRSTGNLPCAPQPTEDSSSSPTDPPDIQQIHQATGEYSKCGGEDTCNLLSDSDDRQDFKLKLRQKPLIGNFESDSFNENFSPTRPSTRRKRKFKRMAIENEAAQSVSGNVGVGSLFPVGGTVKKRVLKHTQENFKSNVLYCGKRKRSHRDRYFDHEKQHSNSVPRQRDVFLPKISYVEYKNRSKTFSKPCERIMPLTKSIVSKIEKISQDTKYNKFGFEYAPLTESKSIKVLQPKQVKNEEKIVSKLPLAQHDPQNQRITHKSGSFESTFNFDNYNNYARKPDEKAKDSGCINNIRKQKSIHRRNEMIQLQFDDPTFMDCGPNEFSSSSSLSSDSEEIETNESDREGDDELTDWPGNEAMVNFTSKHEFKKAKPKTNKSGTTQTKPDEAQDDDTLMSADDLIFSPEDIIGAPVILPTFLNPNHTQTLNSINNCNSILFNIDKTSSSSQFHKCSTTIISPKNIKLVTQNTLPIDITKKNNLHELSKQIESEMSGETSNHFCSSPNSTNIYEPREIRAGCRRIREERPGFSIISRANEELARFLQDARQVQLRLYDIQDIENLAHLAKLYSLNLEVADGYSVLTKTSNTTQSMHVDHVKLNTKLLSDYKRRCYGEDGSEPDPNDMAS